MISRVNSDESRRTLNQNRACSTRQRELDSYIAAGASSKYCTTLSLRRFGLEAMILTDGELTSLGVGNDFDDR